MANDMRDETHPLMRFAEGEAARLIVKSPAFEISECRRRAIDLSVEEIMSRRTMDPRPLSDLPAACLAQDGPNVIGWIVEKRTGAAPAVFAMKDDGSIDYSGS